MTREGWTRRRMLGATAGVGAATALSPPAAAQDDGEDPQAQVDEWLSDADNYDGEIADHGGEESVTVEVGAEGNGGPFAFAPPAVRVAPGTEVVFEWVSDTHNVLVEFQPEDADWEGYEPTEDEGFEYSHTFETPGVYAYYCQPHLGVGMKGAVVVDEAAGIPVVEAEYGDWFDDVDNFDGTTADHTGESSVGVEVGAQGNGGTFAFEPPAVRVDPGTEVVFEWTSDTHNVVVEEQPDGADWPGHEPIEDTGFEYSFTFETPGVYTYFCAPHRGVGMKGAVVVGRAPGGDVGGVSTELTPLEHLIIRTGIGLGLLAPLLFAVGGKVLASRERPPARAVETPDAEPERRLDHHDFDPGGTWTLVLVYLAILLVMWVFTYFVEFLGRGPTVVG